jgi:Tfp pilus assembly protein PilF
MLHRVAAWGARVFGVALGLILCVIWAANGSAVSNPGSSEEQLTRYRNLGKAFYENPTTQAEAVEQFKKALDLQPDSTREQLNYALALLRDAKPKPAVELLQKVQEEDPSLPHTWFNLGIYYKREGQFDRALEQLQGMAKLVPSEAITHYNLGSIYRLQGNMDAARREFEQARDLNPSLAAPHFQLFNLYRQEGKSDDAQNELKTFNDRKKAQENDAIPKEDVEWCEYAEVYEPLTPENDSAKQPVTFSFAARAVTKLEGARDLFALDIDGTGNADLAVLVPNGIKLFRKGTEAITNSGLDAIGSVNAVVPGDFNNDGLVDLCVITDSGPVLYENRKGTFAKSKFTLSTGSYSNAVWIDFDHDYDLDLILLGQKPVLLRNQGEAGFVEHPFPFVAGDAIDAVPFRAIADSKSKDLIISYKDHPGTLYLDQLTAEYKPVQLAQLPAGASHLDVLDLNNDGNLDVMFSAGSETSVIPNRRTHFDAPVAIGTGSGFFADFADRGFTDFFGGAAAYQNVGEMHFIPPAGLKGVPQKATAWAKADFNGDGRADLAAICDDGTISLLTNDTATKNQWLRVKLDGVKNLKVPVNAEVELKAGNSYQKQVYGRLPLVFGLNSHEPVDTVRITWPNGLIQNEMKQPTGKTLDFKEAQRLSGSCPLVFVWNGREYQYVTDVLGVAPLGAMSGDGRFFPTDHTEYISLPGTWLSPKADSSGKSAYEVHLTEELSEVSYFDQVQLIAVDHPVETEIYSNEKWKSPPFPTFRLYGLDKRIYPLTARSEHGDLLERIKRQDQQYLHYLDLDFGNSARGNRAFLVLNGWVDWADGSTFLQQAQAKSDLTPPYLQVKDKFGRWVTVISDMGMPSGKPKTIAVDLTGKFLSESREVRIVTNMCVYWDEIYLGENAAPPDVKLTSLFPLHSDVHFRGFSPSHIHPERRQPEYFEYANPTTTSYWNPTPGNYTRYGDTTELTNAIDDRFVVMGSGDVLSLRFDDEQLPSLRAGWKRDYLLRVEGWAKDRDANTAYSQSVSPLPFHSMSRYPYPSSEHYPDDPLHRQYVSNYLTRPALLLIRPLGPETQRLSREPMVTNVSQ